MLNLPSRLVINGMKLQPCQPSFFDARDAIILADEQLTGGENFCTIWKAFSSRGLGTDASIVGRTPWGGGIRNDVSVYDPSFTSAYVRYLHRVLLILQIATNLDVVAYSTFLSCIIVHLPFLGNIPYLVVILYTHFSILFLYEYQFSSRR